MSPTGAVSQRTTVWIPLLQTTCRSCTCHPSLPWAGLLEVWLTLGPALSHASSWGLVLELQSSRLLYLALPPPSSGQITLEEGLVGLE